MISLEEWQTIRERCVGNLEPKKRVSRDTGRALNTVRKYAAAMLPPKRRGAPTRTPVMGVYENDVDALLASEPKITAIRIAQVLRERHPKFTLCERSVRAYVARRRRLLQPKEAFIRQVYVPGDQVQFDFKDIVAVVGGEETALHLFTMRLSHSTAWFGHCYRTEDQSALFDGLLRGCVEFGGIAREGVFDNARTAVDKVLRSRSRVVNRDFAAFCAGLALNVQFAAPGKGNEKGGVEGTHGYVEDNFFRPKRYATSLKALNEDLLAFSRADQNVRKVGGELISTRLERERSALRPLPIVLPRPCVCEHARVTKFAEVRYKTNRYSVPTRYVGRIVKIEVFADCLRVVDGADFVAEHSRLFARNSASLDPLHFLGALKHKHRAVERAEVFQHAGFPRPLCALLGRLVARDRETAGKQFLRVIELLEHHTAGELVVAVEKAAHIGVDDPAAIALLLDQRPSVKSPPLAMEVLPEQARISTSPARLDGYVVAELKEVA